MQGQQKIKTSNSPRLTKVPALHSKPAFNEIYIRGSRPLPVYIKHANKVFTKHNVVVIHAMTAAINKAVKLALYLMEEYPYLEQQVYTDSVPTLNFKTKAEEEQSDNKVQKQIGQQAVLKQKSAIHIVLTKTIRKNQQK